MATSKGPVLGGSAGYKPTAPFHHLLAGFSGGVTSTLLLHPLDMFKIRQAAGYDPATGGRSTKSGLRLFLSFRTIVASEGLKGLYRGVTPNVCGAGTSWGCYFMIYETLKRWNSTSGEVKDSMGPLRQISIAATAGFVTLAVTNPVTVVRTRMCLQPCGVHAALPESQRYDGMLDALRKTYRVEGARGLYRGFVPGICGVAHGAIQFTLYEQLKAALNARKQRAVDTRLCTGEYVLCAAVSKVLAVVATYPYQVVRACLQDHRASYSGSTDVLGHVLRSGGVRALYRGLPAHLLHVLPNICLVLTVYESIAGGPQTR